MKAGDATWELMRRCCESQIMAPSNSKAHWSTCTLSSRKCW